MRATAIIGVLLLAAFAAPPAHASEEAEFYRGANLVRDGRHEEAAALFRALAERSPGDPFADDALAELARLEEEKLLDPVAALSTYERLLRDYPQSRLAGRARHRAEALRAALGPDGRNAAAVAEWNAILYGFASRPRAESIARAEKLLAEYPDFAAAPRVTYWLGTQHELERRHDEALARYREVQRRWPESEWAVRARRGEGDVYLERGELDAAEKVYRSLATVAGDDAAERRIAEEALARVHRARWLRRAQLAAHAVLAILLVLAAATARAVAGSWRTALRALRRPPAEVVYLAPVLALFVAAALTDHETLYRAVAQVAGGGLAVAWLSGALLEAARARFGRVTPRRAFAHAVAAALAVVCLVYVAVTREDLIGRLVETFRHGPER